MRAGLIEDLQSNIFRVNIDNTNTLPEFPSVYVICTTNVDILPDEMQQLQYTYLDGHPILYVGVSKRGVRARDYKNHFRGTARNSTLRKSLGSLFGYNRYYYSDKKYRFETVYEDQLTSWMKDNLQIYYAASDNLYEDEFALIEAFAPPLNIKENHSSINVKFRQELSNLRK